MNLKSLYPFPISEISLISLIFLNLFQNLGLFSQFYVCCICPLNYQFPLPVCSSTLTHSSFFPSDQHADGGTLPSPSHWTHQRGKNNVWCEEKFLLKRKRQLCPATKCSRPCLTFFLHLRRMTRAQVTPSGEASTRQLA